LWGRKNSPRGARARRDLRSELRSPPNSAKESNSKEEEKEEEEKDDNGRRNFRLEKVDAEALKSDCEWLYRGRKKDIGVQTTGIQKPTGIQKTTGPKSTPKKAGKGTVRKFPTRRKKEKKDARDGNDEKFSPLLENWKERTQAPCRSRRKNRRRWEWY
jgi:hypothetical protein